MSREYCAMGKSPWRRKYGPRIYTASVSRQTTVTVDLRDLVMILDQLDDALLTRDNLVNTGHTMLTALRDARSWISHDDEGDKLLPALDRAIAAGQAEPKTP